uniref:Uncharacterized protein n=1 Tax=Cacopsylla melanoneura TaxID=428564 RepID=A0A8D8Z6C0_9HEMI
MKMTCTKIMKRLSTFVLDRVKKKDTLSRRGTRKWMNVTPNGAEKRRRRRNRMRKSEQGGGGYYDNKTVIIILIFNATDGEKKFLLLLGNNGNSFCSVRKIKKKDRRSEEC